MPRRGLDTAVRVPIIALGLSGAPAMLLIGFVRRGAALVPDLILPGSMALPGLILLAIWLAWVLVSWTVEADRESLRIRTHLGPFSRTREASSGSIWDIGIESGSRLTLRVQPTLPRGTDILVHTENGPIRFGGHLTRREKEWISDVLRRVLTS